MARVCNICGKGSMSGNKVSHSNIKTRKKWRANVQKIDYVDKSTGKTVNGYVCTRCIRTLSKQDRIEV